MCILDQRTLIFKRLIQISADFLEIPRLSGFSKFIKGRMSRLVIDNVHHTHVLRSNSFLASSTLFCVFIFGPLLSKHLILPIKTYNKSLILVSSFVKYAVSTIWISLSKSPTHTNIIMQKFVVLYVFITYILL